MLKGLKILLFTEFICRNNLLKLDVYFPSSRYESLQQVDDYNTINFLGTHLRTNSFKAAQIVVESFQSPLWFLKQVITALGIPK